MLSYRQFNILAERAFASRGRCTRAQYLVTRLAIALKAPDKPVCLRRHPRAIRAGRMDWGAPRVRQELRALALRILRRASECSRLHDRLCSIYDVRYGRGDGSVISGCHRAHYPEHVKNRLRRLARSASASGFSLDVWRMAGARRETWRRVRERTPFGFYG